MVNEDQMPPAERAAYANGFEAGRKSVMMKTMTLSKEASKYVVRLISADSTIVMRATYETRIDAMAAMETLRRHAVVAEVVDLTGEKQ